MRIKGKGDDCWIAIEHRDAHVDIVRIHVEIGRGRFEATCNGVYWYNFCEFVGEFDRFILDRSRTPRLYGDYDNYIAFYKCGIAIAVEYSIGYAIGFAPWPERHHLTGTFEVDQQYLLQMLAGFRELGPGCL